MKTLPFVAAILAFALAGNVFAADPVALTLSSVEEQIGSMTAHVTITDDTGQESTLEPADVAATLDSRKLQVTGVEKTNYGRQPASIVLLVDVSGSMYGNPIVQAQAAVREFIAQVEPDDRIALMKFSTNVTLLQDFTSDRSLLDAAVNGLEAFGDTALYDGVNAAIEQTKLAPDGGKLIVLLSDGVATEGVQNRAASLSVAAQSATSIIAVGLGPSVDVDYLRELTSKTGGRYVQATSAAQLSTTYSEIAQNVVRRYFSDYTLQIDVPPTIDRTVDGTLKIEMAVRAQGLTAEQPLGPLDGAIPPPYEVKITGLAAGGELAKEATIGVTAPAGRELTSVEFLVDGEVVGSGDALVTYALDPVALGIGTYKLAVQTVDAKGGKGYGELSFLVPPVAAAAAPPDSGGASLPILPFLLLLIACGLVYAIYRVVRSRLEMAPEYVTHSLSPQPGEQMEAEGSDEPAARPARVRAATARSQSRHRGRIVVMRESAILAGDLHTTREYDLGEAPLTIGTGHHCDIVLDDDSGLIADEEARVWVQRGRITFHRLTALSAMATAGVTPGWEFFDNNDEMRIGAYRFVFQIEANEVQPVDSEEAIRGLPQEHGMTLRPTEPFGWDNR